MTLAATTNHQIRLARRPVGLPTRNDWTFSAEPVTPPDASSVLVKTLMLSLDPAMRGWMNEGKSYIAPVGIGEVMRAGGVGVVIASENPRFAPGDHVSGLLDVGLAKAGETVVVSGAAGAVGQTVGQLARVKGCRAVGIAGGPEKCAWVVRELGFDACIDYKSGPIKDGLKAHCPKGVDVYFDNVGGEILDAVLTRLNRKARIVICGAISQYNNTDAVKGPANYLSLLVHRARMEGMVVFDYVERFPAAIAELASYLKDGRMKSREDIVAGFDTFPETLLKLFRGENFGKLILQVAER